MEHLRVAPVEFRIINSSTHHPLTLSSAAPRARPLRGRARVSVTTVQSPVISPPPGADRGRQNGFAAMIRPPPSCHSERSEESKVHNRKTGQPAPRFYRDYQLSRGKNSPCRLYVGTNILDSSTPLGCAQNDNDGVAFSSLESGSMVKCLPLSAHRGSDLLSQSLPRRGRDTERGVFAIQLTETEQLPSTFST